MGGQGEIFQRVHLLMDECEQLVESGRAQMERARVIVARSRRQAQLGAEARSAAAKQGTGSSREAGASRPLPARLGERT